MEFTQKEVFEKLFLTLRDFFGDFKVVKKYIKGQVATPDTLTGFWETFQDYHKQRSQKKKIMKNNLKLFLKNRDVYFGSTYFDEISNNIHMYKNIFEELQYDSGVENSVLDAFFVKLKN